MTLEKKAPKKEEDFSGILMEEVYNVSPGSLVSNTWAELGALLRPLPSLHSSFFVFIPTPEDIDNVSSVNSYPVFSMGLL